MGLLPRLPMCTLIYGSTNGNTKKRTTEQEEHIDTPHPKKNGSAGGKWRAEGFIAPSQLHIGVRQ
jgi:hypothetical protein